MKTSILSSMEDLIFLFTQVLFSLDEISFTGPPQREDLLQVLYKQKVFKCFMSGISSMLVKLLRFLRKGDHSRVLYLYIVFSIQNTFNWSPLYGKPSKVLYIEDPKGALSLYKTLTSSSLCRRLFEYLLLTEDSVKFFQK